MKLRVFLYKPGDRLLQTLPQYIEDLGHDVAIIDFPHSCLQYHTPENRCTMQQVCADAVIVGHAISPSEGIRLIEKRLASGCLGVVNSVIICDSMTANERARAAAAGCVCIEGKLEMSTIAEWLHDVARQVDHSRELSAFTVGSTVA